MHGFRGGGVGPGAAGAVAGAAGDKGAAGGRLNPLSAEVPLRCEDESWDVVVNERLAALLDTAKRLADAQVCQKSPI